MGFLASFSNAAFLGLPILMEFMPDNHEVVLASTITIVMATALIVFCMFLLEWYGNAGGLNRRSLLRKVLFFPAAQPHSGGDRSGRGSVSDQGSPAGLSVQVPPHGSGHGGSRALVAQGMVLSAQMTSEVGGKSHPSWQILVQFVKLLLMPLLTWLALDAFGTDPAWLIAGVVLAAMPTGSMSYVISETYRVGERDCTQVILLGTAASIFTVPLFLYMLQRIVLAGI